MPLVSQLMLQALIGNYKRQRSGSYEIVFLMICILFVLVGSAFLICADYQYMTVRYALPQATALTGASVLLISLLGFGVLTIFKKRRNSFVHAEHKIIKPTATVLADTAKELERPIQDNPAAAILIAALAGMIFGRKI